MTKGSRLNASRPFMCFAALCVAVTSLGLGQSTTQLNGANANSASTSQPGQSVPLRGVVLNASTDQPMARALVQVGAQAILTEHDGKFEFSDTSGTYATVRVTKPGYYDDSSSTRGSGKSVVFGSTPDPMTLYLYPEGLITGTLTAPNGDPLPGIYLQAMRKSGDETGMAWMVAGQTTSNADGQFRLPLSAGDYVVETNYSVYRPVVHFAVLPTLTPDPANGTGAGGEPTLHIESGSEEHLDLRPQLQPTHDIHVRIDGYANPGFPQIEAHLPNGLSFFPATKQSGVPGEFLATLPSGSYQLTMTSGERDGNSYAEAAVTVGDADVTGVQMHLVRSFPMPVELAVASSAGSSTSSATSDNQPPSVEQLGLHFVRTDQMASAQNNSVYLRSNRGEPAAFTLSPGKYRLFAQQSSRWFIESANVGGTDLLAHDLEVAAGGNSAPLRIVVSDQTGSLKGTVKLAGNPAGNCWIYLLATVPGATPVVSTVSSSDGSFQRSSIPPGSYRAVAFETHHAADFTDAATLEKLAPFMKSLTVAAGEIASLDIDAIPSAELRH